MTVFDRETEASTVWWNGKNKHRRMRENESEEREKVERNEEEEEAGSHFNDLDLFYRQIFHW